MSDNPPSVDRLQRNVVQRRRLRNAGLPVKSTPDDDIAALGFEIQAQRGLGQYLFGVRLRQCARGPVPT